MNKFKKKNFTLGFLEEEEKKNEALAKKNPHINKMNFADSLVEIGIDGVIFKKDDIAVDKKGVKKTSTGQFVSMIDPKELELGDYLGKGASGFVHKAVYKPTGTVLAIKSINVYDKDKRYQLKNDLKVLQDNNCPFLVKFYGAFYQEGTVKLALEYMNLGSLDSIINKVKKKNFDLPCTPESILSKVTQEILQGLLYLHKVKHQIHRDLKPGNVLINTEGLVKLTDFGIARTLETSAGFCSTFVGTKTYMSPERIIGKEYSYSSDIWSLGLIVFEMATGIFPYNFSKVFIEHVESILKEPEPVLPDNGIFSQELQNFITRCLRKEPKDRDTVTELCAHPWILKYSDQEANVAEWLSYIMDDYID